MTDRPIIFSAPMVRALLAGQKTMTRRIISPSNSVFGSAPPEFWHHANFAIGRPESGYLHVPAKDEVNALWQGKSHRLWPRVEVRDRLYVRESWQLHSRASDLCTVAYAASINHFGWTEASAQLPDHLAGNMAPKAFQEGWRPSIHMPRWVSRITLEISAVRIERLNDISEEDAIAEGVRTLRTAALSLPPDWSELRVFRWLWENLHGERSWAQNPWVVVISFGVRLGNIDLLGRVPAALEAA